MHERHITPIRCTCIKGTLLPVMRCLLALSLAVVCGRGTLTNSYIPDLSHRPDPMQVFTLKQEFGKSTDAVDYACMKK